MHTKIIYPFKNPKKNPNTLSRVPSPEYVTAFLIPLLINRITKIIITNKLTPKITSRTYSLSSIPETYGLTFGNRKRAKIYAISHFDTERILKINPLEVDLITEKTVITI